MEVKFRSEMVLDYASLMGQGDREIGELLVPYLKRKQCLMEYNRDDCITGIFILGGSDLIGCGA